MFGGKASWRSRSVVKPDWCCVLRVMAKRKNRLVAVTPLDKKVVDFGNRLQFLKKQCRVVKVTPLGPKVAGFGHIRHRLEQNSASDFCWANF